MISLGDESFDPFTAVGLLTRTRVTKMLGGGPEFSLRFRELNVLKLRELAFSEAR